MSARTVVIPCYNEVGRLDHHELRRLATELAVLLVDDGSRDDTLAELHRIAEGQASITILALAKNQGKAEAVRHGMRAALADGAAIVGFLDADLATPVDEALRLFQELERRDLDVVLGMRVAHMGANVERRPARHYSGRVFATVASSLILRAPFYDTQCGAKVFRATSALEWALADPFLSRWAFDVELLGRLMVAPNPVHVARIAEVPLERWIDVAGSKLRMHDFLRSGADLALIWRDLRRRRRR